MTNSKISHHGIVVKVEGETVFVKIAVQSACSQCHAKGFCSASEMSEKIIETMPNEPVKTGDDVIVEMDEKLGFKAIFFAFFIPFILFVLTLFISYYLTNSEVIAAVASIVMLVPYYLGLVVFKTYFRKNFVFTCRKINNISQ